MDVYELALNEYNNKTEEQQQKVIYSYFGLAVYFSQCIEETFSNMLIFHRIFQKKITKEEEIQALMDAIENSKNSMSHYINEITQVYNIPDQLHNDLLDLVVQRNYIVHKYFKKHIEKFSSNTGRLEMLEYFCSFIKQTNNLDNMLEEYYQSYQNKLGITDDKINEAIEQMRVAESKRDE